MKYGEIPLPIPTEKTLALFVLFLTSLIISSEFDTSPSVSK